MNKSIFSTYSQGENRVTSTILSVFSKVNFSTLIQIFQSLLEDDRIELIKFENQIKSSKFKSVPDARISGSFNYLIETKIVRNTLRKKQIEEHLEFLESDKMIDSKLILLTPDFKKPKILDQYNDKEIYWVNFDRLIDAILNSIEGNQFIADREKYLLLELKEFLIESNLLSEDISEKVLIVPASIHARNHYELFKVYICQPNRTFQRSSYMAFYGNNIISKEVPKILAIIENFDLANQDINSVNIDLVEGEKKEEIILRLIELREIVIKEDWKLDGSNKLIFLSRNSSEGTKYLENEIINDKRSKDDKRRTAYTQKQTYENLSNLYEARTTSDLK